MCGMAIPSKPSKSEQDYRAEEDHRTLTRAEEVRTDKARMAGVERHHRKMSAALGRVGKVIGAGGRKGKRLNVRASTRRSGGRA